MAQSARIPIPADLWLALDSSLVLLRTDEAGIPVQQSGHEVMLSFTIIPAVSCRNCADGKDKHGFLAGGNRP